MKKAWIWMRQHGEALLALLAALLGAGILWQHHKSKIRKLRDLVEVEKAQREIAGLEARRKALSEHAEEKAVEILAIDERLIENQRLIVSTRQDVTKLTDEEVLDAFKASGY